MTHDFQTQPGRPPHKRGWSLRKKIGVSGGGVVVALFALIVGLGIAGSTSSTPTAATVPTASTSAPAQAAPVTQPSTQVPATHAPATTTQAPAPTTPAPTTTQAPPLTTAPVMTNSQQQAVEAAQGYLSSGSGFSYQGLLQQLTSSSGSGFTEAQAEYAISYLHPDWDQQAVIAAKGYLSSGEGFSRSSLLQQLTSSYGSGFTEAQAEYAVNKTMG